MITRAGGAKGGQGGTSYMYIATQKYLRKLWDLNKGTRTGNYESDRTNSDGILTGLRRIYRTSINWMRGSKASLFYVATIRAERGSVSNIQKYPQLSFVRNQ